MLKKIVFTKKDTAEFLEIEDVSIGPKQVKVKNVCSTISPGTEKANITGDLNISIYSKPQTVAEFPRYGGYSSAGIVEEVGCDVEKFKVGDRVTVSWGTHSTYNVINEERLVKIEDNSISMQEAAVCHIGTFPLAAIRKTRLEIGESAMVMGLGLLGQLAVIFLKAAGAVPVIAVDPIKERREKALTVGADYALDPFEVGFADRVKEITGGGVNVAIEVTGLGAGLNQCLDCMAQFGRISLLGCTRNPDFTVDYYRKVHAPGITIVGAHTNARPKLESYPGYFTQEDDIKTILNLCSLNRINLMELIEEVHSPKDCAEVYSRLVNDPNFPIAVQFDWSKVD